MALDVSPEEFRELAARVTDALVEYLAGLDGGRTVPDTSGQETAAAFDLPLAEEGLGASALDDLERISALSRLNSGRRFPYVVASARCVSGGRAQTRRP